MGKLRSRSRPKMAPPKERNWVTMEQVAARASVSKITVSRVLKAPNKVRPETRERVMTAVNELGYLLDESAGAFSSGRSRVIAALISTLAGSTFASTVDGLSETLRMAGYQLLLATTDYSPELEGEILSKLIGRRPDGIVLTSTQHTEGTRALLDKAGVPVVEIWELPELPIHSAVGFSNFDAGRDMTNHLLEQGYTNISFIGAGPNTDHRSMLRAKGYQAAIEVAGVSEPRIVSDSDRGSAVQRGAHGLKAMLERWPDTDAVFCSSDSVAVGVLSEALRKGIAVPSQLAVAGFGDFELSGPDGLELTTVRIPGYRIGSSAAELLVDWLAERQAPRPQSLDLGYEIVPRRTA